MQSVVDRTLSICSQCGDVVNADLVKDAGHIFMIKMCPKHGPSRVLYWKDAELYENASKLIPTHEVCQHPRCLDSYTCKEHLKKTTDLMLNFTDRCNYACTACFAASDIAHPYEPSLEEIFERLPDMNGFNKPTVVIIGGEPTLREDLPELIAGLVKRGYYPRLTTNGLRLNNRDYLQRLRAAGLEWVILQFDGFSDTIHEKLRGRPLNKLKEDLIPELEALGFKIHLAVMTVRGVNLSEVGKIVEFALQHKNIIWVSFYPHSAINRTTLDRTDTHVSEVMDALEIQTAGRIRKKDFLAMMKLFRLLYRATGINRFKPKLSIFSLLVVADGREYYPVVRLLNPWFALWRLPAVMSLVRSLPNILYYQKRPFPGNLIALNVEKFHNPEAIDLREASNCHMSFITRDGYVPFDFYNNLFRKTRNW